MAAKHEINIHVNTSATREAAPCLGSYLTKETVKMAAFAVAIAANCGLPAIQVMAILSGCFNAIEELEGESLVRVNLDGFSVQGVIKGSFPSADAAFDPANNALELALRLDDDIKNELADVVPAFVTDANLTKLRVDNLMDLVENKPYNVIHGQSVFRVAGFCMVLDDEGAGAHLLDGNGATHELVVDTVESKQLFTAHTAEPLEPGDYKLVVRSRAGVQDGPLQSAFKRVKVLKAATPPEPMLESVTSESGAGKVQTNGAFTVNGKGLAKQDGDALVFRHIYTNDGETVTRDYDLDEWSGTDSELTGTCPPLMSYFEDRGQIVLKRGGQEYTIDCEIAFV